MTRTDKENERLVVKYVAYVFAFVFLAILTMELWIDQIVVLPL